MHADQNGRMKPPADAAASGFTLLETLLAVSLLGIVAVTALYSRAVIIRAEQKVLRLDEARLLMRNLVVLERVGGDTDALIENLPPGWQFEEERMQADMTAAAGTRQSVEWRIWRLEHPDSNTQLEIAFESTPENDAGQNPAQMPPSAAARPVWPATALNRARGNPSYD